MSVVAAAVIGSAVVGAYSAKRSGDKAKAAAAQGAATAADATIESTRMQVEEISRQFDYQQQLLQPFVESQHRGRARFENMLGFDSQPAPSAPQIPPAQGRQPPGQQARGQPQTLPARAGGGVTIDGATGKPVMDPAGAQGPFRDPNVNYMQLGGDTARGTEYGQHVFDTQLAGEGREQDPAVRRARETALAQGADQDSLVRRTDDVRLAAPTHAQDPRFQFAQGTAVVGDEFETSPGYEFALEQGQREVDRRNSAGGNYGGRALMEATRRMQGQAQQEYYNWVGARHADLGRQDAALAAYQGREAMDVQRGDAALGDYRRREEFDLARGDAALDDYFGRRAGDLTRQDQAIARNDALRQHDLQRQDQAYYNYLGNVGAAAGLNVGVPQAVASSQAAGQSVAGAYGAQGGRLASIYGQQGTDQANIALGTGANVNNALQSGLQNYLTAQQADIPMFGQGG